MVGVQQQMSPSVGGSIIGWMLKFLDRTLITLVRGPKLVCKCVPVETGTNTQGVRQLYVNIRVQNVKPRMARGCRGYLQKIELMQGDRTIKTVFDNMVQCIWEFDDQRDSFDIPYTARPAINVVSYTDGVSGFSPRMRLSSGQPLNSITYQHVFSQNGRFRFTGMVVADDLAPIPFSFDAEWIGVWPPTAK
jgi:hypothetical protein